MTRILNRLNVNGEKDKKTSEKRESKELRAAASSRNSYKDLARTDHRDHESNDGDSRQVSTQKVDSSSTEKQVSKTSLQEAFGNQPLLGLEKLYGQEDIQNPVTLPESEEQSGENQKPAKSSKKKKKKQKTKTSKSNSTEGQAGQVGDQVIDAGLENVEDTLAAQEIRVQPAATEEEPPHIVPRTHSIERLQTQSVIQTEV